MRILFDHNAPAPLRDSLSGRTVETAAERGWERLTNGDLLNAAEAQSFDILLTADKGFQHQRNVSHRHIAIVILSRGNWPDVRMNVLKILDVIKAAKCGTCTLVRFETFTKEDAP